MFEYMHGTSYFLMLWKIFELKIIFRNKLEKMCGTSYLNLENICMVQHFSNVIENI
jgi:hypothetical protein